MVSHHAESRFWELPPDEKRDRMDLSRTIQQHLADPDDSRKIWRSLAILTSLVIASGLGFGAVGYCLAWMLGF